VRNKAVSLRKLKSELEGRKIKREALEKVQYTPEGKVNFEKVIELRDLVTDIMLLEKKISLLEDTGLYLGCNSQLGYSAPN
jgi:hypothetical protein